MSDAAPRVIAPEQAEQDAPEASIRPTTLDEFVGQRQLRDNLRDVRPLGMVPGINQYFCLRT